MKQRKTFPLKVRLGFFLVRNALLTLKDCQKKWKIPQMLRVSFLFTISMLRDQKISIRYITSSQNQNGPPWIAYSPSSKKQRMTAQGSVYCPMLVVLGCSSISCLPFPHRNPSLKLCTYPYSIVSRLSHLQGPN